MNIVHFTGGLGNQMFQYALYRAIELYGNSKVKANITWYEEESSYPIFELEEIFPNVKLKKDQDNLFFRKKKRYLKIRKNRDWVAFINYHCLSFCMYFREKQSCTYDERVFRLKNAAISGYWQTERYFNHIKDILMEDFKFPYGEKKLEVWRHRLMKDEKSVAVHIRRGDYLTCTKLYGNLSESPYYKNAIEFMYQTYDDPHFIFFSDDILWVREHYDYENAVYINRDMFECYQPWYDMCLMSYCSHNIIANSSFSWWGAWLSHKVDKSIIAPKKWLHDRETPDIWCEGWIRM